MPNFCVFLEERRWDVANEEWCSKNAEAGVRRFAADGYVDVGEHPGFLPRTEV
jgi:hypothetical protein